MVGQIMPSDLLNSIYPIGSIYMSMTNLDPNRFFGGTWQKLKDRFLLGSGDEYSLGDKDGAATVTLTQAQLPKVSGTIAIGANLATNVGTASSEIAPDTSGVFSRGASQSYTKAVLNSGTYTAKEVTSNWRTAVMNFGNNESHNNMPPYLVVNMWQRIG